MAMPELCFFLLPLEGGAPKGRRLDGESGIFVSQPSPRGEGAPKGRIGHRRHERQMMQMEKPFFRQSEITLKFLMKWDKQVMQK